MSINLTGKADATIASAALQAGKAGVAKDLSTTFKAMSDSYATGMGKVGAGLAKVAEVARIVEDVRARPTPVPVEESNDKSVNIVEEHQRYQEKQLERSAISDSSELLPPSLENNTWGDCTFVLQPNADDANKRMLPEVPQSYRNNDLQLGREVLVVSREDVSPWNKSSIPEQTFAFDESAAPCSV